jgi:glycosyltransferase involved in cell wall biosynthesis
MKAVVDDIAQTHHQSCGDKVNFPPYSLPLVSVIIVNYNYGRFLKQAADSVYEQTYPNIECIIVDNASTDESADVLLAISRQYPGTTILRRSDNGGQSLASKEGFEASSGEHVVFLDADDVLLSSCIATHVRSPSLRIPVGFSQLTWFSRSAHVWFGDNSHFERICAFWTRNKPGPMWRIDESVSEVWPLRNRRQGSRTRSISFCPVTAISGLGSGRRPLAIAFAGTHFSSS